MYSNGHKQHFYSTKIQHRAGRCWQEKELFQRKILAIHWRNNANQRMKEKKHLFDLLLYCLIGRAVETSSFSGSLEVVHATHKRLSEKAWAEFNEEEIHGDSQFAARRFSNMYICKTLGKSSKVVGSLLLSENTELDKTVVAAFLKCLRKPVGKPSLVKRFFRGLGKAVCTPLKKTTSEKSIQHVQSPVCQNETTWDETENSAVEEPCIEDHAGEEEAPPGSDLKSKPGNQTCGIQSEESFRPPYAGMHFSE